ncbi:MAG: hypothetical protein AUI05_03000 [Verrucomicrobia bacterium 13_2_20CM_2_54_15_9cls]|nr:MAG: hypothetical protein AUI05_03000 [Verrucomicrobia bacterium 13_2_20CM_2_54_15_9cls]
MRAGLSAAKLIAPVAFLPNVPLHFLLENHGRRREQIRRKRTGQVLRETPEEEGLCKEAMEGCPVEAIGNDGA